MLEEKIEQKYSGLSTIGKNIGLYVAATVLSMGVVGCGLFEKREYCTKETTLQCTGEQTLSCSKPEGAPQVECECYCRSPPKEPKDPCSKCE